MYTRNLKITDASGTSKTVDYVFADDGKVLMGKDGNTVACIERSKVSDYTEIEEIDDHDLSDAEALEILLGGAAE